MIIDRPVPQQIPGLRALWQQAFGDTAEFLDLFFETAFSPERCRVLTENNRVLAALYWLDCTCRQEKIAYIYAVATDASCRGRGLCRRLMARTHEALAAAGYAGAILVPGEPGLTAMYEKMGYQTCTTVTEVAGAAGESPVALKPVTASQYAAARRKLLPEGGVIQEGENLQFLKALGQFYAGEGFCLWAAAGENGITGELLGDAAHVPGILKALGAERGCFRGPGAGRPFAMYYPFSQAEAPTYLGFAFD